MDIHEIRLWSKYNYIFWDQIDTEDFLFQETKFLLRFVKGHSLFLFNYLENNIKFTIYVEQMKITITKPRERESIRAALKPIIQKHIDDYYETWASILTSERR